MSDFLCKLRNLFLFSLVAPVYLLKGVKEDDLSMTSVTFKTTHKHNVAFYKKLIFKCSEFCN